MGTAGTDTQPAGNLQEYSVSEISHKVRQTVETAFERVRVRGEIGRVTRASSGHMYLSMKEENAVLDCVCWSRTAKRLAHEPELGLEMIATGRLTTYAGRSSYQLVIESIEPAGIGALMAQLEERRRRLEAEGLFDSDRKAELPWLPDVIGVVTSPTGAVLRDIMHRLRDRFPRHVLLWPVAVQGDGAAEQIAAAIRGFNDLAPDGPVPRPDLLIVARGGGSVEDLWAFNEEEVVRAAAESSIPLISAIGHETDTTLIDHASDHRAPTPTAAAEVAVPVRAELEARTLENAGRLVRTAERMLEQLRNQLRGLARGLPHPLRLVEQRTQDLDHATTNLNRTMFLSLMNLQGRLRELVHGLGHPRNVIAERQAALARASAGLRPGTLTERLGHARGRLGRADRDLGRATRQRLGEPERQLHQLAKLLESLSYRGVLGRGYAVVRSEGAAVTRAAQVVSGSALSIEFADGEVHGTAGGDDVKPGRKPAQSVRRRKPEPEADQGNLF